MPDALDPRGLIREAFRIEGIDEGQCRSIFLDWALGRPVGSDDGGAVRDLLALYAAEPDDHPMKAVLTAALEAPPAPRRRGGRARKFS